MHKACDWWAKLWPLAPYPNALFSNSQSVTFMRETGRHTTDHENTHRVEVSVASVAPGRHYCFIYIVCNVKGAPHAFCQSPSFYIPLPHFKKVFHVQSRSDAAAEDPDYYDQKHPGGDVVATGLAPSSPSYCGASVGATLEVSQFEHPKTTVVMRQLTDDRDYNIQKFGLVVVCCTQAS